MRFSTGVSLALLAVGSTLACARATTAPNPQSEESAIRALDRQLVQAVAARDAAAATAFYASDAQLLPPNAPIVTGQAAIQTTWEGFFQTPNLNLTFNPTRIVVSAMGDMALDVGTYQMSFDGPNGRVNDSGKYSAVWQKVNGVWKIVSDAWNSSQPMPEKPTSVAAMPHPAEGDQMGAHAAGGLQWTPLDVPGFKPGIQLAAIHGDPSKEGDYTIRLRFPDGYDFPSHWHPNSEHLTVLRGTFRLGMGAREDASLLQTYGPGDFLYIPGKMPHFGGATGVTEVQLHGMGPFEIRLSSGT